MPKLPRSTSSATSSMASGTIPSRPAKPHPDRLKIMHLFPDRPLVHNALGQGSSPDVDGHVDERADEQTREPECPQAATSDLCGCWFIGLPDPNRLSGQDGRDGVLVDE